MLIVIEFYYASNYTMVGKKFLRRIDTIRA